MSDAQYDEWREAYNGFWKFVNDYENLPDTIQKEIDESVDTIENCLTMLKEKRKAAQRAKQRQRAATNKARKELRDKMIPEWCDENLKPGMIVKVKSRSGGFRRIDEVKKSTVGPSGYVFSGYLTGRHVSYRRVRDPETQKITLSLQEDNYITDHMFKYIQGIVSGVDERGKPNVVPIMDLVEGKQKIDIDAAK